MKKGLPPLIFFVLVWVNTFSQLAVTSNANATILAQTILGSGVTISNATINCGANGAGIFTYTGSTLGVTNGIILTSGLASDATKPAQIVSHASFNIFNDPDLETIIPTHSPTYDVCYIAFDFVPLCNQIDITFEFGSSEYDGCQCSTYDDAFGLFLTGPNPSGGNYTSTNVAVLPNGTEVSINNINNGQSPCTSAHNPVYYIDNSMGTDVVYEGLTTTITSVTSVVPCNSYHMKIAIADVADEKFDSGVFIQGNSLNCTNTPIVTTSATPVNCIALGSVAVTVTNYTEIPTYQWLPGGATTSSINDLTAGTYSCVVSLQSDCGIVTQTVTAVVVAIGATLTCTTTTQNPLCANGLNGNAGVAVSGGMAPYTYTWTTTPPQNTATTTSTLPAGNYTVTVKDNNGCISTASTTLTQPAQLVLTTQSSPAMCTSSNGEASVSTLGGTLPFTYSWNTNPVQTTQNVTGLIPGQYMVSVSDVNNCVATAVATVKDTVDLIVTASQSPDLCSKGVGKAIANPKGGMPYSYIWNTSPVQTTQVADSLQVGIYSVTVTDFYGCISSASITVINQNDLLTSEFSTSPAGIIDAEDPIVLSLTNYGGWKIDTAYLSNGVPITKNPFPYMFPQHGNYTATYYFTSNSGCKDTVTYDVIVKDYITIYIPNAFTPNGDGRNDYFEAQGTFINTFEMYIYDRWGVLIKKIDNITNVWDGNKNGEPALEGTYVYKGIASDIFGKHVTFHGQINLIR